MSWEIAISGLRHGNRPALFGLDEFVHCIEDVLAIGGCPVELSPESQFTAFVRDDDVLMARIVERFDAMVGHEGRPQYLQRKVAGV